MQDSTFRNHSAAWFLKTFDISSKSKDNVWFSFPVICINVFLKTRTLHENHGSENRTKRNKYINIQWNTKYKISAGKQNKMILSKTNFYYLRALLLMEMFYIFVFVFYCSTTLLNLYWRRTNSDIRWDKEFRFLSFFV